MSVLSIQSHVAMGYVGNSAAVFALQRMGHEVWPVHTLLFSNHPGHGDVGGKTLEPALLDDLIMGLARRGVLARCDALLSGYLGRVSTGAVVLDALSRATQANTDVKFVLDPVIGDEHTGVFVEEGIVALMKDSLLPRASIVTPNAFELKILSGKSPSEDIDLRQTANQLRARGPGVVLVTGIEDHHGLIGTLLVSQDGAWRVDTPLLDLGQRANGAGDFFTACFLGHMLKKTNLVVALENAVSSVFAALSFTANTGLNELALVQSQCSWIKPTQTFKAQPVYP